MNLEILLKSGELTSFKQALNDGKKQCLFGLNAPTEGIFFSFSKHGIFVAGDLVTAETISAQANALGAKNKILTSSFTNLFGIKDNSTFYEFIASVCDFLTGKLQGLIVLPEVLFERVPKEEDILKSIIKLDKNITFNSLISRLIENGYTRVEQPARKGQFSVRGDIIDIWEISGTNLVRAMYFGDDLEKLQIVSSEDFSLLEEIDDIEIYPAVLKNLTKENILSFKANIFYDEPKKLVQEAENFNSSLGEDKKLFLSIDDIFKSKNNSLISFNNLLAQTNFFKPDEVLSFKTASAKKYLFDYRELIKDISIFLRGGYKISLFCGNENNKNKMQKFLLENSITTVDDDHLDAGVRVFSDYLPQSAWLLSLDSVLIGTDDLYKKNVVKSNKKQKVFYTPKVGDYVVHELHGVGKCIALTRMKLADVEKDYFVIEYAGGDKFYLPSEQAGSISAFLGSDTAPKLNKLGGAEFERIKEKVYKNVKELAINLLELYSEREKQKGFKYTEGGYLYDMFEQAFEFEETEDQLGAIADVISDMEKGKVMDRLVCGDVGYGKTEVALRAIYKAILNGKQVAFLCPTTILAEQHYATAKKRFEGFMVRLNKLNRLVPEPQVKEIKKSIASGDLDLVIGTHKLLANDVVFKDLGLLVLDEEQRFGVGDKEKIKALKKDIDVLTLSATPIPRTLHMSLSGIRDISIIETPPKERLPIQTFVVEESEELIVDACKKELSRDGQILIVYNRVETIYDFANRIKELLPDVKIGVAHGKLPQKMLEDTILKLYNGDFQILIATTLIENGVDLPLANTLIVIDSDKLGLSQLYQLRGRIGRSNRLAYAYFTFNGSKVLTEQAYKRLEAIMEFTDLGSGFKIAMRDLEIRGAGNVLGKEQHGHMEKVGYDMYCKLLQDAVKELKGEKVKEKKEIKMDISLSAYIPEDYITSEAERIRRYSEISEISNLEELEKTKKELITSYGELPEEVENIILIAYLKNLAQEEDVKRVFINNNYCKLYLYKRDEILSPKLANLIEKNKDIAVLKFEDVPIIELYMPLNAKDKVKKLISLLKN